MRDDFKVNKPGRKPATRKLDAHPPKPEATIVIDDGEAVAVKEPVNSRNPLAHLKGWWKARDRNTRFGVIAAGILVFCALVLWFYWWTQPAGNPGLSIIHHKKKSAPVSKLVPSPLTGVMVDRGSADRPVTGIMIENSVFARPQSGLQSAGVVYEAIAEAGITRFLALYQETAPDFIGPVRSLRPYYIDYAAPYQASIVHVGGSPDALRIVSHHFRNIDQFTYGAPYFYRLPTREAPHNMYTNFASIDKIERQNGWTKSRFSQWYRKPDSKLKTPSVTKIDIAISGPDFHVHYDYNRELNAYARSEGGAKHMNIVNKAGKEARLQPKVVIALQVGLGTAGIDSEGAYYSNYVTSGKGVAYIFQDGGATKAIWTKKNRDGYVRLTTPDGKDIRLNAGQTWVTLFSDKSQLSYSAK